MSESVENGTCIGCGKKLENWPPPEGSLWEIPEGWDWFGDDNDEITAFICSDCKSNEKD